MAAVEFLTRDRAVMPMVVVSGGTSRSMTLRGELDRMSTELGLPKIIYATEAFVAPYQ